MGIISVYREVGTYCGAAEICDTTPKAVRRTVERVEAGVTGRPSNYTDVTELVSTRVASGHGRISAKRLLPVAQAAGYSGSARDFRRLVAEHIVLARPALSGRDGWVRSNAWHWVFSS